MRATYIPVHPAVYLDYYSRQLGQQHGKGIPTFTGSVYQHGDGIGSIFGALVRGITSLPQWMKTGASIIGKEALKTGTQMAGDIATNSDRWKEDWKRASRPYLKRAAGSLLEESGKRLQRGGGGSGRGRKRRKVVRGATAAAAAATKSIKGTRKSSRGIKRSRTTAATGRSNRRIAATKRDIFGPAIF